MKPFSLPQVTDSSFERDVIQSTRPVLVYFWSERAEVCQPMSQVVEVVAAEKSESLKTVLLDVDRSPQTATSHRIQTVPTVIVFIFGQERQRIEGLTNREHLSSTIDMLISNADEEIQDQTSSEN